MPYKSFTPYTNSTLQRQALEIRHQVLVPRSQALGIKRQINNIDTFALSIGRQSCINNIGTQTLGVKCQNYINNINTWALDISMPETIKNRCNCVIYRIYISTTI